VKKINKFILIFIVTIIALGAVTFLGNNKTALVVPSQPTAKPPIIEVNNSIETITLTDTGFVPKDIVIKAGTKVVWENRSGIPATVSSDNHPTHLLYPFLNLGEFADGSSLQVVFDKAGNYSYHNHINPNQKGSVTVE